MWNLHELFVIGSLISGFLLVKLAELRLHRNNYNFLVSEGAEELSPKLMSRYYSVVSLLLPCSLIEMILRGNGFPDVSLQIAGLILIVAAVWFRMWAISSLGRYWSMRCLFLPGFPRIETGPYRFIRHPEYISRIVESIGYCVFFGSFLTLVGFALLLLFFIIRISAIELRQLSEISIKLEMPLPKRRASGFEG